jgi:hypothetical protein
MEGDVPDPETLAVPGSAAPVPQVTSTQANTAAPQVKPAAASKPSAIDLLGGAFGDSSQSATKASPSLAYPSQSPARTSSMPSPAAANGQTRANQPSVAQSKVAAAPAPSTAQSSGNGLFDLDFNANNAPSTNNASTSRKNANDIMSLFGTSSSMSSPPTQSASVNNGGLDAFSSLNLGGAGASSWATPASNNVAFGASSQQQPVQSSYGQANNRAASNSISGGNPWASSAVADSATSKNAQTSSNFYSSPPANNASKPAMYASTGSNDFFSTPASSNNFTSPSSSAAAPSANTASNTHNSMDFFNSQDIWGAPVSNNNSKPAGGDTFGGFSSASNGKTSGGGFDDLWN